MDISSLSEYTQVADCVKTMILARPDYRQAVKQTQDYCLDLALGALPDSVRKRLFSSHSIKYNDYGFIQSLADIDAGENSQGPHLLPNALSGSDKNWWREYAIGLVAQAILSGTKSTAKRLSREKVEGFLKKREQQMDQFMYLVYADCYVHSIDFELKHAWQCAQFMDAQEAARQYCAVLKSSIVMHAVWAASGMWSDIQQELYHHYIKLTTLCLSPSKVDALIQDLKAVDLPIPADLDAGVWHRYAGMRGGRPWLTADELLPICRSALNEQKILPIQGWWDIRLDPIWISEYEALDFFEHYCKDFRS